MFVNKNNALYFSRLSIPYPREKQAETTYYEHIGMYAFRKQAMLHFHHLAKKVLEAKEKIESLRFLEYGKKKTKILKTNYMGIEINTPKYLLNSQNFLKS